MTQPSSYAYQWENNGASISGATDASYELQATDVGATITCILTASNAGGSTTATSAPTQAVAASTIVPLLGGDSVTFEGGTLGIWVSTTGGATMTNSATVPHTGARRTKIVTGAPTSSGPYTSAIYVVAGDALTFNPWAYAPDVGGQISA